MHFRNEGRLRGIVRYWRLCFKLKLFSLRGSAKVVRCSGVDLEFCAWRLLSFL
jgi:hypothetical protein